MKNLINKIQTGLAKASLATKLICALVIILIIACAIGLATYDQTQPVSPVRVAEVKITENGFEPSTVVIKKGARVVWTNTDQANHQVASNPHPTNDGLPDLNSEMLNNNQSFEYVFQDEGNFGYHDNFNPTMNGTIVVEDDEKN